MANSSAASTSCGPSIPLGSPGSRGFCRSLIGLILPDGSSCGGPRYVSG
jgi:hypothetical protein